MLGFEDLLCLPMEGEERFPQGIILHFDIRPLDTISKAPSNGFEKGLLGCKPNGKTFGGAGPLLTPDDFSLCKDPTKEEVSPTSHHTFDPFDIHDVDTGSNDHFKIRNSECGFRNDKDSAFRIPQSAIYRMRAIISRTARSSPTRTARAIILWPILSSSISLISAIRWTLT